MASLPWSSYTADSIILTHIHFTDRLTTGGPGIPHDYLVPLIDLAHNHAIPIIFYDQLGNGLSTHLPEKHGDEAFWTTQLFLDELDNVLASLGVADCYDILGHSWGGMLAAMHAIRHPRGLRRLILADSLADMQMWIAETSRLRAELPKDVQASEDRRRCASYSSCLF